jgi:nucleotide-binding universal stress UspA family protein
MFERIVVGTDGSGTACEAVRQAATLAQLAGARLHIVHAFQSVPGIAAIGLDAGVAALAAGLPEAAEKDANNVLERAAEIARRTCTDVEVHLHMGDAASGLLDVAEREKADLLVVGNRGMSGVKRFVLGSVPNKVSHHTPCNLLIINTTG